MNSRPARPPAQRRCRHPRSTCPETSLVTKAPLSPNLLMPIPPPPHTCTSQVYLTGALFPTLPGLLTSSPISQNPSLPGSGPQTLLSTVSPRTDVVSSSPCKGFLLHPDPFPLSPRLAASPLLPFWNSSQPCRQTRPLTEEPRWGLAAPQAFPTPLGLLR